MDITAVAKALVEHYGGEEGAAAAIGVTQSTVNRWVNGRSATGGNLLKVIAAAQKVPSIVARHGLLPTPATDSIVDLTDQALSRVGAKSAWTPQIVPGKELVGDRNFPVYAAAMGGDGHQVVTFEAIDYVKRPSVLENVKSAYGVYIVGESMIPAFEPGDMALVHPHLPPAREKNVVLYHVPPSGHGDVEAIVKRLLRWNDKEWYLQQYNPAKEFVESKSDWSTCHRIVGKYESR